MEKIIHLAISFYVLLLIADLFGAHFRRKEQQYYQLGRIDSFYKLFIQNHISTFIICVTFALISIIGITLFE
jgi:hypothetical protein